MRQSLARGAAAVLLVALLGGCGGDGATRFSGTEPPPAGGGGELGYAIPAAPTSLDPLRADSVSERTVVSQIFEPLVATLDGPYGAARPRRGLALGWRPSGDFRVWSFRLRPKVRFQDGTPFNASAVLANSQRWRADATGQALLPGLVAADAPRPDRARLIFSAPLRDLPRRLADPRLGQVSPAALDLDPDAPLSRASRAGSGPFTLAGRSDRQLSLRRFRGWWGSRHGLGPSLDEITFTVVPGGIERVGQLQEGLVRVAGDLDRAAAASLRGDPLLTVLGARSGHATGVERSVRGIESLSPEPLSDVSLALVEQS